LHLFPATQNIDLSIPREPHNTNLLPSISSPSRASTTAIVPSICPYLQPHRRPHATKKRAANAATLVASTPRKRVKSSSSRGTASQPISVESQDPSPLPATTFEAQLRESQAEEAIVAPAEGSERATVASSEAADDRGGGFEAEYEDNYDGIV
jgi:hypothetical protein